MMVRNQNAVRGLCYTDGFSPAELSRVRHFSVKFCHMSEVSDQMSVILHIADRSNGGIRISLRVQTSANTQSDLIGVIIYYRQTQPNLKCIAHDLVFS